MNLNDKVVVVTGSSKGIGKATVKAFLEKGCKVVMSSRSKYNLQEALQDIGAPYHDNVLLVRADVTSYEDMKRLARKTVEKFGSIDVWVNNAGRIIETGILSGNMADMDLCIDVDLKGVLYGSQVASRVMLSNTSKPRGVIVNLSSFVSEINSPGISLYCGIKNAVDKLSEGMAYELKSKNIKVINILPGITDTELYNNCLGYDGLIRKRGKGSLMQFVPVASADKVAKKIVKVTQRGRSEKRVYVTLIDRLFVWAYKWVPLTKRILLWNVIGKWKKTDKKQSQTVPLSIISTVMDDVTYENNVITKEM
jgi:NAD(P)-dependent dehydrogenase (short-subunit alcohol dehydrogenase family)